MVSMKILQTGIKRMNLFSSFKVDSLKVGECTVFDIFIKKNDNYTIIIEAGTILSEKLHKKLKAQDKLYISRKDIKKQELSCESLKYYIKHNSHYLEKSLNYLYETNNKLFTEFLDSKENKIDLACVNSIVKSIIFLVKNNEEYLKKTMPHFKNESTLDLDIHSLHVSIYSINIGYALNLDNDKLLALGIAGLLFDLGIKKIDNSIISKESKLGPDELESLHKHTQYSADIIKHNNINNPYIIDAITHHHENLDGSGYPDHIDERHISDFACIISISDVFDALTNSRPYRKEYSSFDAIKMMMKDKSIANKFNYEYLQLFLKLL